MNVWCCTFTASIRCAFQRPTHSDAECMNVWSCKSNASIRCTFDRTTVSGSEVNLYHTNAPDPFKSATYERTKWVHCGHLNPPHSPVRLRIIAP
jgi:hypothetical protein